MKYKYKQKDDDEDSRTIFKHYSESEGCEPALVEIV